MSTDNTTPVSPDKTSNDLQILQSIIKAFKANLRAAILMILTIVPLPFIFLFLVEIETESEFLMGILLLLAFCACLYAFYAYLRAIVIFQKSPDSLIPGGQVWGRFGAKFFALAFVFSVAGTVARSILSEMGDQLSHTCCITLLVGNFACFVLSCVLGALFYYCFFTYLAKVSEQVHLGKETVYAMFVVWILSVVTGASAMYYGHLHSCTDVLGVPEESIIVTTTRLYLLTGIAWGINFLLWLFYLICIIPELENYAKTKAPEQP